MAVGLRSRGDLLLIRKSSVTPRPAAKTLIAEVERDANQATAGAQTFGVSSIATANTPNFATFHKDLPLNYPESVFLRVGNIQINCR